MKQGKEVRQLLRTVTNPTLTHGTYHAAGNTVARVVLSAFDG